MKKRFNIRICLTLLAFCLLTLPLASCAAKGEMEANPDNFYPTEDRLPSAGVDPNGEYASEFAENPFVATQEEPISTFSADVDTASYSYFRKLVNNGYSLDLLKSSASAFRTEEFINYFKYEANAPQNGELFGVKATVAPCDWNEQTVLLRLTLQAEEAVTEGGNNLVFLIDVSGSMAASDKLPLLKKSFGYLVHQLTAEDRVSVVTYSGKEEIVLAGCAGDQKERILGAINSLQAKGSTNGEAGLRQAYSVASDHFIENGNNRIIMASDGDLNVGISSETELQAFVEEKRNDGVYLSVLGFGTGNYRDAKMETLADHGNGVYYYIDGESEAERIFCTEILSTLYTVAKDVKLQITFDRAAVSSYRLIGYENRLLDKEDFTNDAKDAGEVGAGHQVTVCYELTLTKASEEMEDWMKLAVAYKRPNEATSQINEYSIGREHCAEADADTQFITSVIEACMLLHESNYLGEVSLADVVENMSGMALSEYPERQEFYNLLQKLMET